MAMDFDKCKQEQKDIESEDPSAVRGSCPMPEAENLSPEGESSPESLDPEETQEPEIPGSDDEINDVPEPESGEPCIGSDFDPAGLINQMQAQQAVLQEILEKVNEQSEKIAALEIRLEKQTQPGGPVQQQILDQILELRNAAARQEKANNDILRDSKNFQSGVRMRMQSELEEYQKLFAQNVYAPLLTEIAALYINTMQFLETVSDERLKQSLEILILESIAELMEDNGVTMARTEIGQSRSLRLCKTRKTVPTGDADLNGKVARSYNPSFALGNQVLKKEIIDTFIYDASLEPKDEPVSEASDVQDPDGNNGNNEESAGAEPEEENKMTTDQLPENVECSVEEPCSDEGPAAEAGES